MGSRKGVALSRQPRRSGPRAAPRRLSEAQWAGIRRIMAAADVITPLARLDEALLLVAHRAPFLRSTVYKSHRPGPMRGPWDKVQPRLPVSGLDVFCAAGEMERACRAAVAAAAPDDFKMYEMVSTAFAAQLAPLQADPGFQARLLAHRAGVHALKTWSVE
eukprot:Transcript_27729.p3 GENE.Transcript_27729~~Transcript_27729.p3  ORF type:complete len:161 (-),score=40.17 Transcript_27729:207-689(-)